MTFDLEAYPRLRFEHNPLKVVVAQIRFEQVHQLDAAEVRAAIQQDLAERFPRALPDVSEITFAITPAGPTQAQANRSAVRFGTPDSKRVVSVGQTAVSLETTDYRGWEDFIAEFQRLLDVIARHAQITRLERFGLRYVDEIIIDGVGTITDWADVVQPSLLGTEDSLARDPRVVQTMQRVAVAVGDDIVNVRHGLTRRPQDGRSVYLIDTDIATAALGDWDMTSLLARAERFHGWSTNIFGRSLTEAGVARMGGRPR